MSSVPGILQELATFFLEGHAISPGEGLPFVSFPSCTVRVLLTGAAILDVGLDAQSLNHWRGRPCCLWPSQSSPQRSCGGILVSSMQTMPGPLELDFHDHYLEAGGLSSLKDCEVYC